MPWAERALLFFPGHVPKLYINSVRYKLWRQVRNLDGVTAISGTLNCTVGAYAVCEGLANRSDAELKTHCAPFCEAMAKDAYRSQAANQPGVKQKAKFAAVAAGSASLLSVRKCPSRSRLHKECRPHRAVNWAAELPDMARAPDPKVNTTKRSNKKLPTEAANNIKTARARNTRNAMKTNHHRPNAKFNFGQIY